MTLLFELDFTEEYSDEIGIVGRNIDPYYHASVGMRIVACQDQNATAEPVLLRRPLRIAGGILYRKRIDCVPAGCTGVLLVERPEFEAAREALIAAFGDMSQLAGSQSKGAVGLPIIG